MNRAAQKLGRMAKGRPKTLTDEQREQRRQQLAAVRVRRWQTKEKGKAE